jgi:hypothetical protein
MDTTARKRPCLWRMDLWARMTIADFRQIQPTNLLAGRMQGHGPLHTCRITLTNRTGLLDKHPFPQVTQVFTDEIASDFEICPVQFS